jgi:hypothetical protein
MPAITVTASRPPFFFASPALLKVILPSLALEHGSGYPGYGWMHRKIPLSELNACALI